MAAIAPSYAAKNPRTSFPPGIVSKREPVRIACQGLPQESNTIIVSAASNTRPPSRLESSLFLSCSTLPTPPDNALHSKNSLPHSSRRFRESSRHSSRRRRRGSASSTGRGGIFRSPECRENGNGALYSSVATVEASTATREEERVFLSFVEGGGQVKATVISSGSHFTVDLEASLDTPRLDTSRPLLLHWGVHRSDRSAWYLLDPDEAPAGTQVVNVGETEAMRTPFTPLSSVASMLTSSSSSRGRTGTTTQTLSLDFPAELAPLSLNFVLYQPPQGDKPEQYFGSSQYSNLSVPVGMERGAPAPLGATRLKDGSVNFGLYSRHAEGVVLCLYDALGTEPSMEIDLEPSSHRTGDVWHVRILDTGRLTKYGYRCKGDVAWDAGNRFHSRTVLLDPYAKILAPPVPGQEDLPSPAAALGAIPEMRETEFDWEQDCAPRIPEERLSVYRLNVGAFTIDEASGVPEAERGSFLGVARKASYLRSLGVNAVLLQPVAAFDESQGSYFPFNFFAPMPAYGVGGDPALAGRDMKYMVRELHKWGIEVMVEVVVSHTAEGSDQDPNSISFRGIDNCTYYRTDSEGNQVVPLYGAPNAFNCNHPVAHSMIVEALSHWVTEFHVDGFSFPNVQALLTGPHNQPVARPLLVEALSFEPALASCKLIADPCSPTTGKCEVNMIPHWWRWMELNPRFCADVRRFIRGDPGQLSNMATRVSGSGDMFSSGRGPSFSLNYVTSFFGLTLADLVSYSVDSENSWNCGVDGASSEPLISGTRIRQVRNLLCANFLSLGVPVFVMGDEYGNSKEGKLNQQDLEGVFEWSSVNGSLSQEITKLVSTLNGIRRRHSAIERRDFWFAGDINWHGVKAYEQPQWDNPNSSFLAYSVQIKSNGGDSTDFGENSSSEVESCLYVAFNAQQYGVQVEPPQLPAGTSWFRVIDTSRDHPEEIQVEALAPGPYDLSHFSVLVLEGRSVHGAL